MSGPSAKVFGAWTAPITHGAEQIDVPTELACIHCRENFRESDNGAIISSGDAEHRESGLRAVWAGIGHHVDHERYCRGELGRDDDPEDVRHGYCHECRQLAGVP